MAFLSVSFVVLDCTLEISLISINLFGSTDWEYYKGRRQLIECAWWFYCQVDHFHRDLLPSGVFCHKQVLSRDVGHIVGVFAWDVVAVQAFLSHNMASIDPHNLRFNSNLLSIQGNNDPPTVSILHSDLWESWKYGMNNLYWNILHQNNLNIGKILFFLFGGPIIQLWMELGNKREAPCDKLFPFMWRQMTVLRCTCLLWSWC